MYVSLNSTGKLKVVCVQNKEWNKWSLVFRHIKTKWNGIDGWLENSVISWICFTCVSHKGGICAWWDRQTCMIQWETWLVGVNFMMYVMSVSTASYKETPRNEERGFLLYHLNLLCRSIGELLLHIWSDFLKGGVQVLNNQRNLRYSMSKWRCVNMHHLIDYKEWS